MPENTLHHFWTTSQNCGQLRRSGLVGDLGLRSLARGEVEVGQEGRRASEPVEQSVQSYRNGGRSCGSESVSSCSDFNERRTVLNCSSTVSSCHYRRDSGGAGVRGFANAMLPSPAR